MLYKCIYTSLHHISVFASTLTREFPASSEYALGCLLSIDQAIFNKSKLQNYYTTLNFIKMSKLYSTFMLQHYDTACMLRYDLEMLPLQLFTYIL